MKFFLGKTTGFLKYAVGLCLFLCSSGFSDETPFQVGERLTYHFYWGPFMVGRGTFEVESTDREGVYRFVIDGRSNDFISKLYPVEAHLESDFDWTKQCSIRTLQNRSERAKSTWEESWYYPEKSIASTQSYVSGETKWFEIPQTGVLDKFSMIYFMRGLEWSRRDFASAILGNDKGNYEVKVKKLKEETVELPNFAPIPTFKVEPNTEYLGGFVRKGKMVVWVSDDEHKIPVRVVSQLPVGTVSARLVKVENVKDWRYNLPD